VFVVVGTVSYTYWHPAAKGIWRKKHLLVQDRQMVQVWLTMGCDSHDNNGCLGV
jgi:hypothetical protein